MSSLRKKASKLFRLKSSSSLASDDGVLRSGQETSGIQSNKKRSKSLPGVPGVGTELVRDRPALPKLPGSVSSGLLAQRRDLDELANGTEALYVVAMPIPEPALPTKSSQKIDELSAWQNRVEGVIAEHAAQSVAHIKVDEKVDVIQKFGETLQIKNTAQTIISAAKSTLGDDPWFMRALDDVAKIHPFVSVAVIAFKACYNMEMARRQNDKRVIALFKEMKDMIEVLTRLKDITDPDVIGPNGSTIKGRLQTLVVAVSEEIKSCGNTCDTWIKKKVLVKVFVGIAWEEKLATFAAVFASRRKDFELALQIHAATGIDMVQSDTQAIKEMLSTMSQQFASAFSQMRSSEEIRLAKVVEDEGGTAVVQNNETVLRKLFKAEPQTVHGKGLADGCGKSGQASDGTKAPRNAERTTQRPEYSFDDFKAELREDLEMALQSNFKAFEGKFKLYYDQLETNLHRYIHEEGEYLLKEMSKGPHSLIRDSELRVIWQEMNWRRNVKARLFVITLRDHFADKGQDSAAPTASEQSVKPKNPQDSWAGQYVSVKYLRPIMDAIDDDGSGHITTTEVNRFMEELPASLDWSHTTWLAYWAIGWQTFAIKYREEILQIFARMFAMRTKILPENRNKADEYLQSTWQLASELAKSLKPLSTTISDDARERFAVYVNHEENRLHKNLAAVKYDIDALDTVYGIVGSGRIEKHILTLLSLMLRKDLELFDLATQSVLHEAELDDAADSIIWVYDAFGFRYRDLLAQFDQQRLDVDKQMKMISCEIFDYYHDNSRIYKMSSILTSVEQTPTDEQLPSARLEDASVNNYALQYQSISDYEGYNTTPELLHLDDLSASDVVKSFLGEWNGYTYDDTGVVSRFMASFFAHVGPDEENQIVARSWAGPNNWRDLKASVSDDDGTLRILACFVYDNDISPKYYSGSLQADGSVIGTEGESEDVSTHHNRFMWMRTPAELMRLRPLPPYLVPSDPISNDQSMVPNKARAMFDFAIRAVILQYRKRSWSWSHFKERRDIRKKFMQVWTELEIDYTAYDSRPKEFDRIARSITNSDRRFYDICWTYDWGLMTHHRGVYCDNCRADCHGSRYVCLNCIDNATPDAHYGNTVDFCCLSCSEKTTHLHPDAVKLPHMPHHDLLQVRTVMHTRDMPLAYTQAKHAAEVLRQTLSTTRRNGKEEEANAEPQITGPDFSKVSPPNIDEEAHCGICKTTVTLPCWICVHCLERDGSQPLYICDTCEEQVLLKCSTCEKPFKQTRWFYGFDFRDTFQCARCIAKRQAPALPAGDTPHTYIHHLVRYYDAQTAGEVQETTTEERIAAIELKADGIHRKVEVSDQNLHTVNEKVDALNQKVDAIDQRMLRLEGYLERIERLLLLDSTSTT